MITLGKAAPSFGTSAQELESAQNTRSGFNTAPFYSPCFSTWGI